MFTIGNKMKQTIRKFGLTLAVAAYAASASCLATENGQSTSAVPAPAAAATEAPTPPRFVQKGPVVLSVYFVHDKDKQMDELRIVKRTHVVGTNAAKAALGVSLLLLGGSATIHGSSKDDSYGDEISDERDSAKLASPFRVELPTAIDQKITDIVEAENLETGAAPYKNALTITPIGWNLVYHELAADKEHEDEYVLRFAAGFSKVLEGEEDRFMRPARKVERSCVYLSKPQPLATWQQNNYDAVAVEQKLATEACVNQIAPYLPAFLGIDSTSKIRTAKINCKNSMKQCVADSENVQEPNEAKKVCKTEYKQCVNTDVKPMIDMTPVGQCKVTFAACKATVLDKARAINPTEKPPKSEYVPCATEYRACVAATR